MPVELLGLILGVSSIGFPLFSLLAISKKDYETGKSAFFCLCMLVGSSTWAYIAGTQPKTYEPAITATVITSVTENQQILSTAVYDKDGKYIMIPLRGFLPAGMKVSIEYPHKWYSGVYYEKLETKISLIEENKDSL